MNSSDLVISQLRRRSRNDMHMCKSGVKAQKDLDL